MSKENIHVRKTIEAIKKCNIHDLDEFFEFVLYVSTHGSPDDMKKLAGVCSYVLEQTNYFNRRGKKKLVG